METVPSTQDVARAAFADSDGPVLVTAERQMAGRGRTGSGWIHAPRAVAASLAFDAPWRVEERGVIPLLAGLAMRAALGGVGADVCLKWPNDVMAPNGDKVGGILSEAVDDVIVVGAGVNLFFPDAPDGIAGCFDSDPGDDLAGVVAARWADHLLDAIDAGPSWDRAEYRRASLLLGEQITWDGGGGQAVDIAADGALIVQQGTERVELRSGAVRLVRRATLPGDDAGDDTGVVG